MSTKNDGGQAFPTQESEFYTGCPGMSLREWFAGQALCGMLSNGDTLGGPVAVADAAFKMADEMLLLCAEDDDG